MGKSLNNHIELAATPEETRQRVMQMVTDPQRARRSDPGNPDVCNVFTMHKVFSPAEEVAMIDTECRRAGIGCVDCKKRFAENLNRHLEPFRQKRAEIGQNPDTVWDVLHDGAGAPARLPKRRWSPCARPFSCPNDLGRFDARTGAASSLPEKSALKARSLPKSGRAWSFCWESVSAMGRPKPRGWRRKSRICGFSRTKRGR